IWVSEWAACWLHWCPSRSPTNIQVAPLSEIGFGPKTHMNRLPVVIIASAAMTPLSAHVSMSKDLAAKCLLEVMGKTYISGPCDVSILDDAGSFTLTEKAKRPYFAYVLIDSDDKKTADGSWNRVRSATHAHAPLGSRVLRFSDGCWSNEGAKV